MAGFRESDKECKFPIKLIKCHDMFLVRYVNGYECLGNITFFFTPPKIEKRL